jgi:hypothetical protein
VQSNRVLLVKERKVGERPETLWEGREESNPSPLRLLIKKKKKSPGFQTIHFLMYLLYISPPAKGIKRYSQLLRNCYGDWLQRQTSVNFN